MANNVYLFIMDASFLICVYKYIVSGLIDIVNQNQSYNNILSDESFNSYTVGLEGSLPHLHIN